MTFFIISLIICLFGFAASMVMVNNKKANKPWDVRLVEISVALMALGGLGSVFLAIILLIV